MLGNRSKIKKVNMIFFIILLVSIVEAQIVSPKLENINKLKKTTTFIVLEDNPFLQFDAYIKQLSEKNWDITPYKFININEFEKICTNPNYSFLLIVDGEYTLGTKRLNVDLLTLVLGDKSGNINKMTEIISVPLSTLDEDGEYEVDYGYKIIGIVNAINHLLKNITEEIKSINDFSQYLSENKEKVKKYTLLIDKQSVANDINTEQTLKKYYSHDIRLSEQTTINEAINVQKSNHAFVHTIGKLGNYSIQFIIDCQTGEILYNSYRLANNSNQLGLTKEDLKAIN